MKRNELLIVNKNHSTPSSSPNPENDYNHLFEIEGIKAEPLKQEEVTDKSSINPHTVKIFKMIVIGDTGKS